jgi:hypothetical protein
MLCAAKTNAEDAKVGAKVAKENRQRQVQKQIPCGDDNKKNKGNNNS